MRGEPRPAGAFRTVGRTHRLHRQVLQVTGIGGWECDLATERLNWTEGVYRIHDLEPGVRIERGAILDLYAGTSRQTLEAIRAEAIRRCRGFSLDVEVHTTAGNVRWVRITADVATKGGRAVRIFGAQQDVTSERLAWERLRQLSECDALTGLANRGVFDARYREVLRDSVDHGGVAALVLVDLDRFKAVNDGLGHAAGDECLRQTATRLRQLFPDASVIARLGGDEFALLLRAPLGASRLAQMLRRAAAQLCEPVFWKEHTVDIGASTGAAMVETAFARGAMSLFDRADAALYAAKAAGGHSVVIDGDVLPSHQRIPVSMRPCA